MNTDHRPVIVVAAFKRPDSLQRILHSLDQSQYPFAVKLIISIDNNSHNQVVADVADKFEWRHGVKQVTYHNERLGLRKHILSCGDHALVHGSAIILEDDLFVSPYFYEYALKALAFYADEPSIAGISLYSLPIAESNKLPFTPIEDDSDVYFIQMAASLGQVWTSNHWKGFKAWYDTNPELETIDGLPSSIKKWPVSSWKKYYIGYLIVSDKYFVFPRKSYTTNFNDPGENMISRSLYVQVPLQIAPREPKFVKIEEAINIYDAYAEIKPDCLNKLTESFLEYEYDVDLYGRKDQLRKPYVITSRPVKKPIIGFERSMKPHEMNLIRGIEGVGFSLSKNEDVIMAPQSIKAFLDEYAYFYTAPFTTKILLNILKFRIKNRIKAKLGVLFQARK